MARYRDCGAEILRVHPTGSRSARRRVTSHSLSTMGADLWTHRPPKVGRHLRQPRELRSERPSGRRPAGLKERLERVPPGLENPLIDAE